MTGHSRIPSKIQPRLFISLFNKANNRAKFYYWGGRKTLLLFCLSVSDNMEIETTEVFQNSHLGSTDQKKLFVLTSWGTGQKLVLIEGCQLTSSNMLPNCL